MPVSVYVTWGPEEHKQMLPSGGQSDEKNPSVMFPSEHGTHLSTHRMDKKLSQPCPTRGLNLTSVVWKRDATGLQ
ncbi:hypothetical protein TNCV_4814221 [Trichonephila clavipes]|nr:hypothetical protein TNCV_4814221 [Trichonephila clavipes]